MVAAPMQGANQQEQFGVQYLAQDIYIETKEIKPATSW